MPQVKEDKIIAEQYSKVLTEIKSLLYQNQPQNLGQKKFDILLTLALISNDDLTYPIKVGGINTFSLVKIFDLLYRNVNSFESLEYFLKTFKIDIAVNMAEQYIKTHGGGNSMMLQLRLFTQTFKLYAAYGKLKEVDIPSIGKVPVQTILNEYEQQTDLKQKINLSLIYHMYVPRFILQDMLINGSPLVQISDYKGHKQQIKQLPTPPQNPSLN